MSDPSSSTSHCERSNVEEGEISDPETEEIAKPEKLTSQQRHTRRRRKSRALEAVKRRKLAEEAEAEMQRRIALVVEVKVERERQRLRAEFTERLAKARAVLRDKGRQDVVDVLSGTSPSETCGGRDASHAGEAGEADRYGRG